MHIYMMLALKQCQKPTKIVFTHHSSIGVQPQCNTTKCIKIHTSEDMHNVWQRSEFVSDCLPPTQKDAATSSWRHLSAR